MKDIKMLFSYAYAHFSRGYNVGLGRFLGLFNALNILTIGLKLFVPTIQFYLLVVFYIVGIVSISLFAVVLDFIMLRMNLQQAEYLIGVRDNPVINVPIGDKEILNYRNTIAQLDREIINYSISLSIIKSLKIRGKNNLLKNNIKLATQYKKEYIALFSKRIVKR